MLNYTSSEWITHQHRDTLSSIVGHPPLLSYLAIADGEAIGRVKFEMTEVCIIYDVRVCVLISRLANAAALWPSACERRLDISNISALALGERPESYYVAAREG